MPNLQFFTTPHQNKKRGRTHPASQSILSRKNVVSVGCFLGGFIIAFGRFLNQSHAYGLGGNLDPADPTVHHGPDLLNIRLKLAFADAGHLPADAAQILRLTAPGNASARLRSLTRIITYS